jgi:hypothetical protein
MSPSGRSRVIPGCPRALTWGPPKSEFAQDSALEGTGFELLVPRREARDFRSIPEQLRADDLNRSRR